MKTYTVFIVEDHPLIKHAYKTALDFYQKQNDTIVFNLLTVKDCDEAIETINDCLENNIAIDITFLDISLPKSKDKKYLSGEDIGLKISSEFPDSKIIVATTFNDNYRVHSLFKNLNPDGFLIKNDVTPEELLNAIGTIIKDPPYYSKTVIKLLRSQMSSDLLLDQIDRKILYELSIGTRMKELPSVIPISLAGIEKRKRHLKEVFNVKKFDDKELIRVAKEKGFI